MAHDFRVGLPDARLFPYEAWRPLIARELRPSAAGVVGYGDPAGHAGLRAALARHIGLSRGVRTGPDDVLVTTGTQQALDLIGQEWLLYGTALSDDGESALSVACVWRMRILFSTDEKEESPTILSGAPCMPDAADDRCMSIVQSLRRAAERLASRVTGSLATAQEISASTASAATARFLASLPKTDLATISAYQSTVRALTERQTKLDLSELLTPQMTAVQAVLASMPKVTPTVLSTQQTATETIAGLKKAQTDPEDPSRDAEVSDTAETDGEEDRD
ncbi:hypothetical protein ACFZCT_31060 [Streptomyces qaidamensis]|uniref:hypothetical protein n=1 Tax=Streptomyces qaidamensis TaxID=1783515 RepID=UPI0036E2F3FD